MRLKQNEEFIQGYNSITEIKGKHADMQMDFGILKLGKGEVYTDRFSLERVIWIIYGSIEIKWDGETIQVVEGESFLDFSKRGISFCSDYLKNVKYDVLICSHNQTLKMLSLLLRNEDYSFEKWTKMAFVNGYITPLGIDVSN